MFERYDEPARRTLFFARYAASELGSRSIEGEHLLLGLIREPKGLAAKVLSALPALDIRRELESLRRSEPKLAMSVEIPFSAEAKRVLQHAVEEADNLTHRHIGPEHLLLALVREETSVASSTLAKYGLRLDEARERIRQLSTEPPPTVVPNASALAQVRQIMDLASQLGQALSDNQEAAMRVALLHMDLQALKSLLDHKS